MMLPDVQALRDEVPCLVAGQVILLCIHCRQQSGSEPMKPFDVIQGVSLISGFTCLSGSYFCTCRLPDCANRQSKS